MKRLLMLMLALLLVLSLAACDSGTGSPAESTGDPAVQDTMPDSAESAGMTAAVLKDGVFTADSVICGIGVGGMDKAQALAALKQAAESYELNLTVNGEALHVTGEEMGLQVDEAAFEQFCRALESGEAYDGKLLRCTYNQLYQLLSDALETPVRDASVTYDEASGQFVAGPAQTGRFLAMGELTKQAEKAACTLAPECTAQVACSEIQPAVADTDEAVQSALKQANGYLELSLEYSFVPEDGAAQTEKVDRNTIAGFIAVSDSLEVSVDEKQVAQYAAALAEKYNVVDSKGDFVTYYGTTLGYTVDYYGQQVDTQALTDDLLECLKTQTSGTRTAPYSTGKNINNLPYGGNYVEISLGAQHLWVFRDGECVVSTSIVSGSPAYGNCTPTGIYSIYDKDRNCYLVGEDYDTFVSYWMAFTGAYGLHDASWRGYFGGEIYVYDGSHGCVNLPVDVAPLVYDNVQVGTKVILYGGITEVEQLEEKITGTASYAVAEDAAPFKLDASLRYGESEMTYTSSNPNVVTVSEDGTVTVVGIGTATITVHAEQYAYFSEATMTVQITVHSACDEGRHSYGAWTQTAAPSCQSGSESQTCSKCGHVQTREIPAVAEHTPGEWHVETEPGCESSGVRSTACTVCGARMEEEIPATGHSFTDGSPVCDNGCGTPNPDYIPPETTLPEDPEETLPEEPEETTEP